MFVNKLKIINQKNNTKQIQSFFQNILKMTLNIYELWSIISPIKVG